MPRKAAGGRTSRKERKARQIQAHSAALRARFVVRRAFITTGALNIEILPDNIVLRFFPFRITNISRTAGADAFSARERIRKEVDLGFLRLWKFLLA